MNLEPLACLVGILLAGLSLACLWLILYPKFRDGFFVRLGLSFCVVGFGAVSLHLLDNRLSIGPGIPSAMATGLLGVLLVMFGYEVRCALLGHPLRRRSDWFFGFEGNRDEAPINAERS